MGMAENYQKERRFVSRLFLCTTHLASSYLFRFSVTFPSFISIRISSFQPRIIFFLPLLLRLHHLSLNVHGEKLPYFTPTPGSFTFHLHVSSPPFYPSGSPHFPETIQLYVNLNLAPYPHTAPPRSATSSAKGGDLHASARIRR